MTDIQEGRKLRCALVLAAGASITLAIGWPILRGEVYVFDDLGDYYLPLRAFYARAIENGHSFLWFPDSFNGYYVHAEGATALFQPFNWLLYATLPLYLAFDLELLRSYPLLFGGTYLLLRRWAIAPDASLFGALIFTFGSFNFLHYLNLSAVATVAYLPWLLWATDLSLRGQNMRWQALGRICVATVLALAVLHAYPQYLMFSVFVQAGYVLLLARLERAWKPVALLALLALCGVAAGGVQWLPIIAELPGSERSVNSLRFLYSFSLEPINLVQLAGPYVFESRVVGGNVHEFGIYAGAVVPALCCWLWIRRRHLGALRPLVIATVVLACLSTLLALGEYGGLYQLQVQIPLLNSFRAACRYILLQQLSLAVLSAVAFQDLLAFGRGQPLAWRSLRWLAMPPALAVAAIAAAFAWEASGAEPVAKASSPLMLGTSLALMVGAAALVAATARGLRSAVLVLVVFAAADQAAYGLSYLWRHPTQSIEAFTAALDRPPAPPGARIRAQGSDPSLAGFRNVGGYAANAPPRPLGKRLWGTSAFSASQRKAFQVSSVSWVRVPPWDRFDGFSNQWVPVDDPLQRMRLVSRSRVTTNVWRDLATIDPGDIALTGEVLDLPDGAAGTVDVRRDDPGSIAVVTRAATRQLLVVSESYHDGWRAQVDGQGVRLIRVYGEFLGCVVPAGEHRVELEFDPPSLRTGARISLAGAGLALAFTAGSLWRARRFDGAPSRVES